MTRARGFTLIEIVVVLLIFTIILGMVGMNLNRGDRDHVRDEADRLVVLLQAARDEAILKDTILAVEFHPDGYRFLRLDNKGKLVPLDNDDTFVPRRLPEGMTLTFDMDGTPAGSEANLILDPSGSVSAFTLTLRAGHASWLAQGQANGVIRSQPPESVHAG